MSLARKKSRFARAGTCWEKVHGVIWKIAKGIRDFDGAHSVHYQYHVGARNAALKCRVVDIISLGGSGAVCPSVCLFSEEFRSLVVHDTAWPCVSFSGGSLRSHVQDMRTQE